MSVRKVRFAALPAVAVFLLQGCGSRPENTNAVSATGAPDHASAAEAESARATAPAKPAPVAVATPQPRVIRIPEGTALRVRTATAISTRTSRPGDRFTAFLDRPLVIGGETIAPQGAAVHGQVTEADPGGRVKGVARIAVRATAIEIAGRTVPIDTGSYVRTAKKTVKKDALKVGVGSGIGAAIGAIAGGGKGAAIGAAAGGGAGTGVVLATRGEPAVIASETILTFRLRNPVTVPEPRS